MERRAKVKGINNRHLTTHEYFNNINILKVLLGSVKRVLLNDKLPKHKSGIFMPLSSLPSNYGIGTLGIEAYRFIDFLCDTKQKYWQMLPLVPLGEGNSPYKSPSCFAGELLYIDLDMLVSEGLLSALELTENDFPDEIDFKRVRGYKLPLLKKACENFDTDNKDYLVFLEENADWLEDYAIFSTALSVYDTEFISELPNFIKKRTGEDYDFFLKSNKGKIRFFKVAQYFFYAQYFELKRYAESKGVMIIGDIPFYVSPDSADVWGEPENFLVDGELKPDLVAGVPPDYFSAKGQLWGNPIYNWDYLRKNGYAWWIKRLKHYLKVFDVVRIDHFRAFADYYTIPFGSEDATKGSWEKGEGINFWQTVSSGIGGMRIIVEDLGAESPLVKELVNDTGFPNMRVLQFGFSGDDKNPHRIENIIENCIVYTGTHDNNTTLGYYNSTNSYEREIIEKINPEYKIPLNIVKLAMSSKANTVIIPITDYLMLDETARINIPGVPEGNWKFRVKKDYLSKELFDIVNSIARR